MFTHPLCIQYFPSTSTLSSSIQACVLLSTILLCCVTVGSIILEFSLPEFPVSLYVKPATIHISIFSMSVDEPLCVLLNNV